VYRLGAERIRDGELRSLEKSGGSRRRCGFHCIGVSAWHRNSSERDIKMTFAFRLVEQLEIGEQQTDERLTLVRPVADCEAAGRAGRLSDGSNRRSIRSWPRSWK
jgi:hypothetical protein